MPTASTFWRTLGRPPWRTLILLVVTLGVIGLVFTLWTPGKVIRDGRHDRGTNGLWMQHGWLGDDGWFQRYGKDASRFRQPEAIHAVAQNLKRHRIRDVFPHLCPCADNGQIAESDAAQLERFLDGFTEFRVMPWVGGVSGVQCFPQSASWRATFVSSVAELVKRHPRLAGVHVNIEPLQPGTAGYLALLEELKRELPKGKVLSVAAYPPPTLWHRFPDVHWDEAWFREVASRCDHMAVMAYDTGLRVPKLYEHLMARWTRECLSWAGDTPVLMGVPAYDDAESGYHDPAAENLHHALAGIHAGLLAVPGKTNFRGVSVYCEWEMDAAEWQTMENEFCRHK